MERGTGKRKEVEKTRVKKWGKKEEKRKQRRYKEG